MNSLFKKEADEEHNFWMSYTDLMSGFLVVFIIISAVMYKSYQDKTKESNASLKNLIFEYEDVFIMDDPSVKVKFDEERGSIILTHAVPDSFLFASGNASFQESLGSYLEKIRKPLVKKTMSIWKEHNYKNVELRIEGHTDPNGIGTKRGSDESFLQNLDLSSQRANNVYHYIFNTPSLSKEEKEFVKKNMISVGYSFSQRVQHNDIEYSRKDVMSRRIEFRIISK